MIIVKPYGYIRVSGLGQADKDGPRRQREAILEYCDRRGWPAPTFFEDLGVSGTVDGVLRPAVQDMMAAAVRDGSNCLIVENMSRLARDLVVSELTVRELGKRGFNLYATDAGDESLTTQETEDPGRRLIRQMFAMLAEYEKTTIVLKLRAARNHRRKMTGRCEGDKKYGRDARERQVLELIKNLRSSDVSWRGIAKMFNETGIKKRKGDRPWGQSEVYDLWNKHIRPNETNETGPGEKTEVGATAGVHILRPGSDGEQQ